MPEKLTPWSSVRDSGCRAIWEDLAGEARPVSAATVENRVAVVLCADIVGYSRLMGTDEEGTHAALQTIWRDVVDPQIEHCKGRLVRRMGDGLVVEFRSAIDAAVCALAIQEAMRFLLIETPPERQIQFRIGITIGDVVSHGEAIYGDAVNIASRLESLAEPGGITVSRAVRDQIRDRLSVVLRDLGEHQVENSERPVRVFRITTDQEHAASSIGVRRRSAPPPRRPAMAVLPFQNHADDSEAEFFLDSVAEDLITELSRARWFSVIARNTAFTYKGKEADAKLVGRELGVRYVLEGSLRNEGDHVRIGCQLVETASGQPRWAEAFDGTMEDSFDLQDRIVESVIGSVGPVLRSSEIERAQKTPEEDQNAYDLTLRAMLPAFAETAAENSSALVLLDEALEMTPDYPMASALSAWCHQQRHLLDWPGGEDNNRETATRLAQAAIINGGEIPLALALGAAVRAALTRDHHFALAATDRAMMITNNSALVLAFDALTRCLCGAYDKAIEHAEKAIRLSPLEPLNYYAAFALGSAYLFTGRDEEAVINARKAIDGNPKFAFAHCLLALACARLGQTSDALTALRGLLEVAPQFRIGMLRRVRFADAKLLETDLALLRTARIPE
jgi:adenylate cyclase